MSADQIVLDYAIHPDDRKKVATVQLLVSRFMQDHVGTWFTPAQVRRALGLNPETEITARLRDLRKPEHGAWQIDCERIDGAWRYRLRPHVSTVITEAS